MWVWCAGCQIFAVAASRKRSLQTGNAWMMDSRAGM